MDIVSVSCFADLSHPRLFEGLTLRDQIRRAMSTIELQTEIVQMIKDESDTSILEAIRTLLYKVRQGQVEEDFTDEEIAELDAQRARRLSGESKGYTAEESIHMLRAAQAKDEAA